MDQHPARPPAIRKGVRLTVGGLLILIAAIAIALGVYLRPVSSSDAGSIAPRAVGRLQLRNGRASPLTVAQVHWQPDERIRGRAGYRRVTVASASAGLDYDVHVFDWHTHYYAEQKSPFKPSLEPLP